jgi:hypothetical protein
MKSNVIASALSAILLLGLFSPDTPAQRRWGRRNRVQTVYCESGDMRRHWCSEGIGARVRLLRQRSDAPCVRGRTWGKDRGGIWVDRGYRADFEIIR